MKKRLKLLLEIAPLLLLANVAQAVVTTTTYKASDYYPYNTLPPTAGVGPVHDVGQALGTLSFLIMWAQIIFWTLAVVFGLYSAYLYLFSGGDPEKTKAARNMLIYTAVAVVIAVLAYGLPNIVADLLGAGAPY